MAEEDKIALFRRLSKLFKADREFSAKWRKEAKEDFDFVAGEQVSEDDKAYLKALMRPVIVMNRTQTIINAVSGQEMANRQEVQYIPREEGDVKPNELLTEGARWFRDCASGDDEDSEAFLHTSICGMGWTDTTLDFDSDPAGSPDMGAVGPLEMFWDRNARKNNLTDAERVWRARKVPRAKARRMFPDADPSDFDAAWARIDGPEEDTTDQDRAKLYQDDGDAVDASDDDQVTIVHCQYVVMVPAWDVISPLTGEQSEMGDAEYRVYARRAEGLGLPVKAARKQKRVIRDCWLGAVVLQSNDALCQDKFRYQCVTGYRDENKGTFYGLVRGMKDPQRWANKWLSQTLDIMNSNAKGGAIVERGVTDDPVQFEKDWARPDRLTWVDDGALAGPSGGRIREKQPATFPAGFYQLMEFAFQMIQTVPGVSPELLGQADRDQPASLEYQRRQAGMTILQPLFKNLKRYRREQGHVILYILQNHMSDGRLIRILGDGQQKYVPLIRQADVKYDIIVDDAPTSPNQKEMVWAMIGERFWDMPTNIQMAFLKYSPFPTSVVESLEKAAEEEAQSPMAQLQQRMAMLEAQVAESKDMLQRAQAEKANADAQATITDAQRGDGSNPEAELALKARESEAKIALKEQEAAGNLVLQGRKQAGDMALAQQKQAGDFALKQRDQMHAQSMQERNASADIALRDRTSSAEIARRDRIAKAAAKRPNGNGSRPTA